MKRVGIVTLYHKNNNYGGQLQAYAMQKLFSTDKSEAQLIAFEIHSGKYITKRIRDLGLGKFVINIFRKVAFAICVKRSPVGSQYYLRKKRFGVFMDRASHTKLYSEEDISETNELFDIFVCGSDQVWNPGWWNDILLLRFTHKSKYAYAASIARETLEKEEMDLLENAIKDFKAISVREKQAKRLLSSISDLEIEVVLDPTLLLDREEWYSISIPPAHEEKYALIYMLGTNWKVKKWLYTYCKSIGLTVIQIAFTKDIYFSAQMKYADIFIGDAGPEEWLGWIQNASCIFTDSFHGTVFSVIFEKDFWCFNSGRISDIKNINSRIYSFLDIIGLGDRLIQEQDLTKNSITHSAIEYDIVWSKLQLYRKNSYDFIKRIIE